MRPFLWLLVEYQTLSKHSKHSLITQPVCVWETLLKEKLLHIGENRIQETLKKTKTFPQIDKLKLHLIGHLQKNKINKAINTYDVIQTVDSIELAKKINQASKIIGKKQEIYLQINISNDPKGIRLHDKDG